MKAIVNGSVLHCVNYRRKSRRKNCIVGIDNTVIELIVSVVIQFTESDVHIAFGREVKVQNVITHTAWYGSLCGHVKKIVKKHC